MLKKIIEDFVGELLPQVYDFEPSHIDKRDPIHKLVKLKDHEVSIIKTPLFQRLKRISQMGALNRIFDYVSHTRYSHCIGVVQTAGRILDHLQKHHPKLIDTYIINNVRVSALLHDIGHGPFSHLTERIIYKCIIKETSLSDKVRGASPHEIISYYIITSDSMRDFLNKISNKFEINLDCDEIANYVIGQSRNPLTTRFIAEIINGAFDADKLDYSSRDARFIGTKTPFEPEFLIDSLRIHVIKNIRQIVISKEGLDDLLDLMYHKLKIARWIYDARVRIADSTIFEIFKMIIEKKIPVKGNCINNVGDILRLNETDIIDLPETGYSVVDDFVKRVRFNNYYIPAVELDKNNFKKFLMLLEHYDLDYREVILEKTRNEIAKLAGCSPYDVIIDIPSKLSTRSLETIFTMQDKEIIQLNNLFSYTSWLAEYIDSKWRGYIFCDLKYRKEVKEVANKFLMNSNYFLDIFR